MLTARTKIILIIVLFTALFLIHTDRTAADLVAERTVRKNNFTATTLSFSQNHTANNLPISLLFKTNGLQPGGFDVGAVRIKKEGKLNFQYRLKVIKTGGNDELCQALKIQVMQKGSFKFQGRLLDLVIDANVDNNQPQDWIFFIGLDDNGGNLRSKSCEFDFNFKTWRNHPDERKGFYAERSLSNNILSGTW